MLRRDVVRLALRTMVDWTDEDLDLFLDRLENDSKARTDSKREAAGPDSPVIPITLQGSILTFPDGTTLGLEPLFSIYAGLGGGEASDTLEKLLTVARVIDLDNMGEEG